MSKTEETVWEIATPIVQRHGVEIYDVEMKKEGPSWFLRLYIDKPDGVDLDDCEAVSRELDKRLDELGFSQHDYLEVSSPGLDRTLRLEMHFAQNIGKTVEIKLFKAVEGSKQMVGTLSSWKDGNITLKISEKEILLPKENVAQVKLYIEF